MFHYIADQKFNVGKKFLAYSATVFTIIIEVKLLTLMFCGQMVTFLYSAPLADELPAQVFLKRPRLALQLYLHFRIA